MNQGLKGFRDFYPREMKERRAIIDTIEETARQYGFREIGTPALERSQLYIDKSGEEIIEQLYAFTDRGGRDVVLTPELTPTVARMVVARGQELSKPIKWFSTRPFWRYEQVQQGRFREFYQLNVDIFGAASPAADAEILSYCADALTELGLSKDDFEFRVSHRDILGALLESIEPSVDSRAAIRAIDKRAKVPEEEYYSLLGDAGLASAQVEEFDELLTTTDLESLTAAAETDRLEHAVANLQAVLDIAAELGVREYCSLSLETARGLDYYTGVVFECFDSTGAVSRSVFGGGRYDDLIESYGGQPTPAVGVAPGLTTLSLLLERAGVLPSGSIETDYYVLIAGDTRPVAGRICRELRGRGNTVEMNINDRGFGAQLEYADAINAHTVVIVGEQDLADGVVTVKDMGTGEQTTVPVDGFPGNHEQPRYADFS